MIQFDSASTIYLQVADFMTEQILTEAWPEQERIPSIRELAALVQVNPNTVMRSFAYLQDNDIISNRRGVGYFVNKHGKQTVQALKKGAFIDAKLPRIFHEAALLAVTPNELRELYNQFLGSQA